VIGGIPSHITQGTYGTHGTYGNADQNAEAPGCSLPAGAGLLFAQAKRAKRLPNVFIRHEKPFEPVINVPVLTDHQSHAAWNDTELSFYTKTSSHFAALVAQKPIGQSMLPGELFVRANRITADADNGKSSFLKFGKAVTERTHLFSASRRLVFRIKEKNCRADLEYLIEIEELSVLIRQLKVRGKGLEAFHVSRFAFRVFSLGSAAFASAMQFGCSNFLSCVRHKNAEPKPGCGLTCP
jgi:hypothetical protein